ncbi:hypothetical protein C7451_12323 [Blastomonas natatoria]|uniref:Uncharacterized protein n=1 Tax=Blastomonas natatoria TaxID=34015 RepID=A0A2V3UNU4_9SPHN|nr:hypothetical protein [Blastomonas natatoria]PXW67887.1 hypothetical protein C7451_12323 [Blastomonas natatoria]
MKDPDSDMDVQLGLGHNARMLHAARPVTYYLLHDYEVEALARGERVAELEVFYGACGMMLSALPGIVSEWTAMADGRFSFAAVLWIVIGVLSLGLAIGTGFTGFAKRQALRDRLTEMRGRPKVPIKDKPELDYRLG